MVKHVIAVAEVLCLLGAISFALLWAYYPEENYEPYVTLCTILIPILETIRRFRHILNLRVFVSVGATYTDQQELFVSSFENLLKDNGCTRLVVGRDAPVSRQPILQVKDLMKKADAVIVIAFTRHLVKKAIEKPDAKDPNQIQKSQNTRYPTVWNQIEAGIAFGLDRPLLVFVEEGLKQEAMLKDRLEFKTIVKPLDQDYLRSDEFRAIITDFIQISRRRSLFRLRI